MNPFKLTMLIAFAAVASLAFAIDLSPAEQAQLNALPPALRTQVIERIKQYETAQGGTSTQPVERPEVVKSKTVPSNSEIESEFEDATDLASTVETPVTKHAKQDLKQFGYDLFAGVPTTFAPATEIPVPSDYIIGPGDQIRIQFFGKESASYELYVSREGILQIPDLGPISVAGQLFSELKANLAERAQNQLIGTEIFVSLGELRSIRVFILGDANRPGSYTVSALSTLTNALFVSGGISPIGSLRNIQLKRSGETVAELDLYDLLLRGNTSGDARLQPGDVIFVPPVGQLVGISGEVKRPAIYELKNESSIGDLVAFAGGYTAQAFPSLSQIERIAKSGTKEIIDIDLSQNNGGLFNLKDGDVVRIYSTLDRADNVVVLSGQAERPGNYQWTDGIRIRDIVSSYEDIIPSADLEYSLVVTRSPITGKISTRSFSLREALTDQNSPHNLSLNPKDKVILFDSESDQREGLENIVRQLISQATSAETERVVSISGHVRHPGEYPLDVEMTVADLIRAAGNYSQEAYTLEAELLRYVDNGKQQRETVLVPVNLNKGPSSLKLRSFDQLTIKRVPEWSGKESIVISGEVRFPGSYTIERGETISKVIRRAGGVTELAHPEAAVFLRESLRRSEAEQIARLRDRLQEDVSAAKLREGDLSNASVATAEQLLNELDNTEAAGRLVIDLPLILSGDFDADVRIKNGDELRIPQAPQSVTIIGSVNYPTSHFHKEGLTREDYISLSGGLLKRADKQQIYVVRANGQVNVDTRSRFFPKSSLEIRPGDTIVVPVDVDRMKPLKYWGEVSQIIYQLALGAAAVNSF